MDARRWLNELVHDMVEFDQHGKVKLETVVPYIDGGTEGFRGQSRVIIPYKTSCQECTMALQAQRNTFALCTIAETPRLPEHCIEYIYLLKWKDHFTRPIDKDSIDDVNWVYEQALKRAETFGIQGVNYSLTLGVLKNVIPAIASTNAIIAASTCLEAIKILSYASIILKNYFMYMGHEGIYSSTTEYEKKENCNVCSVSVINKTVDKHMLLKTFISDVIVPHYNLVNPSVFYGGNILYLSNPDMQEPHLYKLEETLEKLVQDKVLGLVNYLTIKDENTPNIMKLRIKFH